MSDISSSSPTGRWRGSARNRGRIPTIELLATLIVAVLAFILADAAAQWPNFNPDESRWLSRAHYLGALGDPFGPTWSDQYMTRGQPPLGSYAMGAGLLAQGRDLETNAPWDFSLPWEENIALGHKPAPDDLAAGRRTSAALVALTAVAMIGVARSYLTRPWAIVAGALFAVHPFTVYIGSIAMADALFGLLIVLAAWAAAAFARRPSSARALLVGVLLGLGGATKLSPLVVAAGISAAGVTVCVIVTIRHRRLGRREAAYAGWGLVIGVAALTTFVASYPYLWTDPVERTRQLFAFRVEEMAAQSADWPVMAVPNRIEAVQRVHVNFTERFNLSASTAALLGGRAAPPLLRQVEFLIPSIGIVLMLGMAARDGPYSPRALALAVLGGQVMVTVLGMRSEFDRYHVPMALLGAVAAAVALEWLARTVVAVKSSRERGLLSSQSRDSFGRLSIGDRMASGNEGETMWVLTKSDWPVLVNLSRTAHIGYQQIAKFDPRTRVVASAWEQEHVLADCADGDQARALVALISRALANGEMVLDLRGIDLAQPAVNVDADVM